MLPYFTRSLKRLSRFSNNIRSGLIEFPPIHWLGLTTLRKSLWCDHRSQEANDEGKVTAVSDLQNCSSPVFVVTDEGNHRQLNQISRSQESNPKILSSESASYDLSLDHHSSFLVLELYVRVIFKSLSVRAAPLFFFFYLLMTLKGIGNRHSPPIKSPFAVPTD